MFSPTFWLLWAAEPLLLVVIFHLCLHLSSTFFQYFTRVKSPPWFWHRFTSFGFSCYYISWSRLMVHHVDWWAHLKTVCCSMGEMNVIGGRGWGVEGGGWSYLAGWSVAAVLGPGRPMWWSGRCTGWCWRARSPDPVIDCTTPLRSPLGNAFTKGQLSVMENKMSSSFFFF